MRKETEPLLATKIRVPRRMTDAVRRPRLDAYLDLVRARRLTLIKAPPGFGKTTLVRGWAELLSHGGARVAWYSIGAEDDDPGQFFRYIGAALRQACGAANLAVPDWLASGLAVSTERRLAWLTDGVSAQQCEIYIVLDDYHEIGRSDIHQALSRLLRRCPENLHVVILGRLEPPLDLSSLRLADQLVEIDAAALRFSVGETRELLQGEGEHAAAAADAQALHAITGGWIAALRAALLTARLQGNGAPSPRVWPSSMRPVGAVFEQLVERLPADLVQFMERASITRRICPSLAERLTEARNAQSRLEELERLQLFFGALDEEGHWFGFHPLFAEFLQKRITSRSPDYAAGLHRDAGFWFARESLWPEAIHHMLAAGHTQQALCWIEAHAMEVLGQGDVLPLLNWEQQLRSHLLKSPPRLRLAFAWAHMLAMNCDKALALLDGVAADVALQTGATAEALRRECQALRCVLIATTGDYALAEKLAAECRVESLRQPWVPNAIDVLRASLHLQHGRWECVHTVPPMALDASRAPSRDRISAVYRLSIRGLAEYRQGQLDEAARLLGEAMRASRSSDLPSHLLVALPAPTLALVRYEQDRLGEAEDINAEHLDINRRAGPIDALIAAFQVGSRTARQAGRQAVARSLLDEGEAIGIARRWPRVEVAMLLEKVLFGLIDGRIAEATACAGRIRSLAEAAASSRDLDWNDFKQAASVAGAWLDLASARYARAALALAAQRERAARAGRLLDELRALVGLALARFGLGETRPAIDAFLDACQRARSVGAVRSLVDQPLSIAPLIAAARADRTPAAADPSMTAQCDALTRACREPLALGRGGATAPSLSPRERNILSLVASGRSNKEIARGLGITPETVKTHVKKILTKLGANNRAQAVAMAAEA